MAERQSGFQRHIDYKTAVGNPPARGGIKNAHHLGSWELQEGMRIIQPSSDREAILVGIGHHRWSTNEYWMIDLDVPDGWGQTRIQVPVHWLRATWFPKDRYWEALEAATRPD